MALQQVQVEEQIVAWEKTEGPSFAGHIVTNIVANIGENILESPLMHSGRWHQSQKAIVDKETQQKQLQLALPALVTLVALATSSFAAWE